MLTLIYVIKFGISAYILLILIAVVGSWFPNFANTTFMRYVRIYVDPYLNFFKKIIPPIGGVLDLSPILGYAALRGIEYLLVNLLLRLI